MVIDIIGIKKQRVGSNNYPPAVIAMLVAAILQMLHLLYVVATSGRGFVGRAKNVIAATAFFFLFQVGMSFCTEQAVHQTNVQLPLLPLPSFTSRRTLTTAPETLPSPSAPVSPRQVIPR